MEFFEIIVGGEVKCFLFFEGFHQVGKVNFFSRRLVDHSKTFNSRFCSEYYRNCLTNATKVDAIILNTSKASNFSKNGFGGNNSTVWACVNVFLCQTVIN